MANTYTNHGFTNIDGPSFNTVLDLDKFQTELCFPFLEYTTGNGSTIRLVAMGFNADFGGRVSLSITKYNEEDSSLWDGKPQPQKTSTRTLFVDASGIEASPQDALEDDLTREILNPEGQSYDPKQYKKKIVAGYNNEFDFFVKNFFKGAMITSDYVLKVLANVAGVSLPV
jgi:hypothetical protein